MEKNFAIKPAKQLSLIRNFITSVKNESLEHLRLDDGHCCEEIGLDSIRNAAFSAKQSLKLS
jgi:hypothetical protein